MAAGIGAGDEADPTRSPVEGGGRGNRRVEMHGISAGTVDSPAVTEQRGRDAHGGHPDLRSLGGVCALAFQASLATCAVSRGMGSVLASTAQQPHGMSRRIAARTETETAIQIWVRTALSELPWNAVILRCCLTRRSASCSSESSDHSARPSPCRSYGSPGG